MFWVALSIQGHEAKTIYEGGAMIPRCLSFVRGIEELDEQAGYVYFLVRDDQVVYVGQTTKLRSRIKTHRKMKGFDQVFYIHVNKADLNAVETKWIRHFDPPLNGTEGFNPMHNLKAPTPQQPYPYKLPPSSVGHKYTRLPIDILDPA